jgi:hypothetical protein
MVGFGATSTNYIFDWARSGRELLVASTDVVVFPVEPGPTLQMGPAHRLFTMPSAAITLLPAPDYQRFLVSLPLATTAPPQLAVETNWWAALKSH